MERAEIQRSYIYQSSLRQENRKRGQRAVLSRRSLKAEVIGEPSNRFVAERMGRAGMSAIVKEKVSSISTAERGLLLAAVPDTCVEFALCQSISRASEKHL